MDARELRIGNLVYLRKDGTLDMQEVLLVSEDSIETDKTFNYPIDLFEPIPLTEEWLLKFGFEKSGYEDDEDNLIWWYNDIIKKSILPVVQSWKDKNKFWIDKYAFPLDDIKYVHQLQNLYFALTGEELKIK